jgi:hypothetical protein
MYQSIGNFSDEQLADLAERDSGRLIAAVLAARYAGKVNQEVRATWILASSTESRRVIKNAVAKQAFRPALNELDELCDGAHLEVLQQIGRTPPALESLAQFYAWIALIAQRHVVAVTRLVREKERLRTYSLSESKSDDYGQLNGSLSGELRWEAGALDPRIEFAPEIVAIKDRASACRSQASDPQPTQKVAFTCIFAS